ncbi:MAG: 2-amino-4-hydroxy-6-hydroxymethyldihydropteridine diphosphokinase [Prevotella sp.]|nr:2-amino-4-hydroxy-6-hydroxymethyldihydropteridine diphosphokinase [Prevotella sp.]
MHSVLISLASNHEQEKNLSEAREALAQVLVSPVYTSAIWTEPYHSHISHLTPLTSSHPSPHTSHLYLNQLVYAQTDLDCDELNSRLKEIEKAQGRNDEARRQGLVPVDLDLLQYDQQRFHLRDWQRPYIQLLLPELSNQLVIPGEHH